MKIRIDSVFLSSVLFTIALLNLIPAGLWYFSSGTDKVALAKLDAGFRAQLQTWHYYGVASLAITLIALIVVWTGYIKRARFAWLVMFVVTWAWAFPLFAWPYLRGPKVFTLPEWLYNSIYEPGYPRTAAQLVVTFALMVIALLLPIKSFLARKTSAPTQVLSLKLIARSAVTVLLIVIALFVWIHAQVYEIPPEQLNFWQQLPPPPPPPTPGKTQ
jgi:hypothetical protein